MTFGLQGEIEIERWLRPFTGAVLMPSGKRLLHKNTRLFFDLYWQILHYGYIESEVAAHARKWEAYSGRLGEISMSQAVFDMALQLRLIRSIKFYPHVTVSS